MLFRKLFIARINASIIFDGPKVVSSKNNIEIRKNGELKKWRIRRVFLSAVGFCIWKIELAINVPSETNSRRKIEDNIKNGTSGFVLETK